LDIDKNALTVMLHGNKKRRVVKLVEKEVL
jgi:hypothetical protein